MTAQEALLEARALLDTVTPLKRDCGKICGTACCLPDEDGKGGMLLFPEEEKLYAGVPGFVISPCDDIPGGTLICCLHPCDRALRPLSCRLFPLWPGPGGIAQIDPRARIVCPLARMPQSALSPAFIEAVNRAAALLRAVPEHREFLESVHQHVIQSLLDTGLWEASP